MSKQLKVSIIIPLYVISDRFFKDFEKFDNLDYKNFEILVICDKKVDLPKIKNKVKIILTNKDKTGPAEKRDLALQYVTGDVCAFIDDDAYPDPKWLSHALNHFSNNRIVAMGGPGLTPKEDGYMSRLGGLVYESLLTSGGAQNRFVSKKQCFVRDWPAYNLIVRTKDMKLVGGYGSSFYGGEDTFLCLKLIKRGKILYDPQARVLHHRRPIFYQHLMQIWNIGIHRGYFARVFPETSRHLFYFIPSLLTVGLLVFIIISLIMNTYLPLIITLLFFVTLGTLSVIRKTDLLSSIIVSVAIILTHITYGTGFIKGLFTVKLIR